MQATHALETILDRVMVATDDINVAIEVLIQVAEQNQSPAVADFLLGIARRLKKARGNIREANAILDDALYTFQDERPDITIRSRRK